MATPNFFSRGRPRRPGDSIITATTASPNPRMAATKSDIFGSLQGRTSLASPPRSKPVLKFKLTELAARTNLEILESCNYDLQAILLEDAHSPHRPGSDFRPTAILDPVLQGHPLWSRAKKTLMHGAHLPVEPIEEKPRLQDLLEAIEFGNHKSATKDGQKLLQSSGRRSKKVGS